MKFPRGMSCRRTAPTEAWFSACLFAHRCWLKKRFEILYFYARDWENYFKSNYFCWYSKQRIRAAKVLSQDRNLKFTREAQRLAWGLHLWQWSFFVSQIAKEMYRYIKRRASPLLGRRIECESAAFQMCFFTATDATLQVQLWLHPVNCNFNFFTFLVGFFCCAFWRKFNVLKESIGCSYFRGWIFLVL